MARFLALDWDQNQLHVIAAKERGSTVQVQRASVWQEGQMPSTATAEELGKALRERLREAGIAPAPVLICLGRDRVIVKDIRYPAVPESEEPAVVRFQTVKELTDGGDDVIIDYLSEKSQGEGERKAMALVIRRDVLATYQKLCEAAGLKLVGVAPRLIGVSHCIRKVIGTTVVTPPPDPADGVIAVVVIGEKTAEFCVLRGPTFLLSRSVASGSNLAGEIRRNLAVHAGQSPQNPIRAVYVAGKGSGELRERLGDMIEQPVHTFDPFAGSETLELPLGQRGSFAGAMGLLFARAEGELPINFLTPRQPKPPQNFNYRLARLAIVAAVALIFGLVVLGRVLHANIIAQVAERKELREKVEEDLLRTSVNAVRLKGINDWDTLTWIDELYDLTARIPDVNLLKVKSFTVDPLPPKQQSRFVAKVTIRGELFNRANLRAPLNQLIAQFAKDGYYTVEPVKVESNTFILVVNVERRAPGEYRSVVKDVGNVEEPSATTKGGMGKSPFGKGMPFGKGKAASKTGEEGEGAEEGVSGSRGKGKGKRSRE